MTVFFTMVKAIVGQLSIRPACSPKGFDFARCIANVEAALKAHARIEA